MTRFSPGPTGFLTFVTLAWLTGVGVLLAWLATPTSGSDGGVRAAVARLAGGR